MKQTIKLRCTYCKKEFERLLTEYNRGKNKDVFCSRSCFRTLQNKLYPTKSKTDHLKSNNRLDDFTSFRYFLARARYRKKLSQNLTLEYLKTLWENQKGICPFTGWELILPRTTTGFEAGTNIKNASLDRIDNNKGYEAGNVRFISLIANYARNSFCDDDLINFCKATAVNKNSI